MIKTDYFYIVLTVPYKWSKAIAKVFPWIEYNNAKSGPKQTSGP